MFVISILSDLTLFVSPIFPVGGTRRWKTKNAIFLRETGTIIGESGVKRTTGAKRTTHHNSLAGAAIEF